MKLKQFIFALVAMLSFGLSAYAQDAVVVNSFAELKAVLEKGNGNAGGAMRITSSGDLADAYGPVKLGADIVLEGVITVTFSYLELDLNGFTISGNDTKYIKNLTSTTISDGSTNKTGVIACPIYNGDNENKEGVYLEIQGGTFKNLATSGAAITNYGECVIYAGNFFSEDIALINHNSMEIDGGTGKNVYIEGKNHTVENSGTFVVDYVAVAGTREGFKAEVGNDETVGENIDYYNVAVNGQAYGTLQAAIDAAGDGDLVRLFGDITESNVTINKAITLDGNGKKLTTAAGIKVAATGTVNIKDFTVEGATEYALYAESPVEITNSTISGAGAVYAKVNGGRVGLLNTNLTGTAIDVIRVASNVTLATEGGSITAANDNFIVAGDDECTGALLSIMTDNITAENYVNLNTENNTVRIKKTHEQTLYNKGYATEKSGNALTVYNAVANVGNKNYRTLADALTAAADGATVTLLWADYKAPIAMAGTVCGNKTVTITGTAEVDWDKDWLYVGRNGEGNGKLIFREANLTSKSVGISNNGVGLNVSCKKEGSTDTYDGEVEIINSHIQLDYLIGKGNIKLDNSTLNVYEGFAVGARPASETGGQQRTVTMDITNGSNVVVNNHSGQGLGYEANGVMNIDATSKFETTQSFLVTANGTMNVNGGTVKIAGTLTNNGTVYATGAANLDATVTGAGWFYMNGVSLDADTKLTGAKVAFINGENTVKGSTIDNGWFSVGIGQNAAADAAAAFAQANGITLGNVTVNVSENAVVGSAGNAYNGWVGSAYSADKTQRTYTLNINNSLAAFGYMHVSKDGTLTVDGRSADNNRYTYDNANVNFYAGDLIVNGVVTFNNADAWVKFTKMSVDHVDGILNINGDTKFESSIHNGGTSSTSLKFWKAGKVNVAKTATVEIDNGTVLVEGAELNIAGNVTAKGAVTGNGAITLTDVAALYTAPADIAVVTNVDNKVVVYENAAYQLKAAVAKINGVCYLTFAEAMAVANATTGEVTVGILAPVEFVNGMELKGNYTTINFVGENDEAKMTINQSPGGDYLEAHGKNVNFTDLTLAKANPAWSGNSGHMGNYFSVQGGTATYTNCIFLNGACTSGGTATYTDCTFQNATEYGLWAYDDALVTVNGGTFDSKKGIKVYSEDESTVTTTLTVENATFTENVSAKPAVAVGYAASITLKGNTYNNPTAHIELDSGSDADCEGVTFVAQDANGNDISATLDMTDRSNNNADCGVLVDGKVYTSVTTAVKDAEDGSIVTILYSTDEAVEFVPGVEIKLAEGVTADNVVVADRLKDYVVLPEDVNESNFVFKFGDKTVTDGTNYYATLQAAVEAVAGQPNAVLYCKPGADVGSLQHAPVTSTLTVYGNGANVTGDTERDFDLGNTDPSYGKDITADMTLTVKHLNGCGAWGAKATEHTVNLVFENCANMGKVFITGTTGTLNITMTDCAFEGVIKEAIYSNADGAITLINVAFSNLNKAVNLNHKAAGTQTVTIDGCTFTDCGADVDADQIPVRVLSSVAGAKSVLTVNNSTFTGTTAGGADILLDYDAIGLTNATITKTNANVKPENESGNAEMVAVTEDDVYEYCNADVQVGETKYRTFGEAVTAVKNGGTITLLNDITATADYIFVQAPDVQVTIEGNNKTFAGTITVDGKSARYETAALTVKNVKFDATGITYDACVRLGDGTDNTRYTNNVTIDGCTFTDNDYSAVAVKSYTGGDYNLQIINCTAEGMHSLAQLANVEKGLVISGNTANTKNGINLNYTYSATISDNIINVQGYAVRAGVNGSTGGNITLTNNTLKTDNSEGDPVIVLRGSVDALNMTENVVSGDTHIKGTAATVSVDANYWDGKDAPVVAEGSPAIRVNSYYADEALTDIRQNHYGNDFIGYTDTYKIWGEVWGNAFESFVIKVLDANNNVMGTTSLNNINGVIDGDVTVTWSLYFDVDSYTGSSWTMKWTTRPTVDNIPAAVELWVDGVKVGSGPVKLNNPDDAAKKTVAITKDGYIKAFHTSFANAYSAAQSDEVIVLLEDVNATDVVLIDKSVTIDGNGKAIKSSASRVIRVTTGGIKVTFSNLNVVSNAVRVGTNDIRAIAVDANINGVELTLNNCTVDFTDASASDWAYGVNVARGNNHTITINGGTYEGANVVNIWGANNTVNIDGATLNSLYAANDYYYGLCVVLNENEDTHTVNVKNTTFNGKHAVAYEDNITAENNTDNTDRFVAKVGDVYYASVNKAIEEAESGATVQLLAFAIDEYIKAAGDKSITIQGYNLYSQGFFTLLTGGMYIGNDQSKCHENTVVVKNIKFVGKGIIVGDQQNVTIENNVFENITDLVATSSTANENAISVVGKNVNVIVKNNTISNVKVAGINLRNTLTAVVEGNTISNTGHNSITITGQDGATATSVTVSNNTLSDWAYEATEGRAMRISNIATVSVNENVMSHSATAPEEFAKVTGATAFDASKNYWNGNTPLMAGVVTDGSETPDPLTFLSSYYTDAAKTNLVTFTSDKSVAKIGNLNYESLAAAVEGANAGETVTVLRDAEGAGVVINKDVTIDFGGYTYTFTSGVGSTGTESNGLQILKDNTVTLKNGTLNVAESAASTMGILIQNYANLTVTDMDLVGENLNKSASGYSYVLSNNCGNVLIDGETNITANTVGANAYAFDAYHKEGDTYYTAPVVTVKTTGTITGNIECSATILIYDGTYTIDVTEWCAPGFAVVNNHDGTYGIEQVAGIEELTIVHEEYEGEVFENQNVKTIQTLTYTRNLEASGKYLPFCLPFEIPVTALGDDYSVAYFNNVHAYDNDEDGVIEKMTVEVITIKTTNAILRANTPYLIKANSEQARALSIELTDATLEKSDAKVVNMASASVDFTVGGVYSYMSGADVLSGIENKDAKCFYPWAGEWYNYNGNYNKMVFSPFEVYLTMAPKAYSPFIISEEAMQSIGTRVVGEELDGTTYIYDVVIEDGEEVIYDLQGRRVNDTEKGIYIKGGKKVLVK